MGKKSLCLIFFLLFIDKINSQEIKFGWSLGSFGWSYNFIGKSDIVDAEIIKFNISFEKTNIIINTSILYGTNKNNREEMEPLYNSFFPLEIIYNPFKWKYVHISLYGRGAWEIGYIGNINNPNKISDGFYGAVGFRFGIIPIESYLFKYRSHAVSIFSEYTIRNEFKLGVSIDLFDIIWIGFKMWEIEGKNKNN